MRRVWWTWDLRVRWAHGFSMTAESYEANYRRLLDAAPRYGVEGIVIWGFLRDRHGGVDSAKRLCDRAERRGLLVLPGVGIDDYGGVYYDGESPYSLDVYLREHPEAVAVDEAGKPATHSWPANDPSARTKGCPSNEAVLDYYRHSLTWLLDTFGLRGFQIEQGDSGVCYCERCRARPERLSTTSSWTSLRDAAARISAVVQPLLETRPDLTIITETYCGMLPDQLEEFAPHARRYPPELYVSWQAYNGVGTFKITEASRSPTPHGCLAVRTNNDLTGGEVDDRANIREALRLAKRAGLDMTYIYGEYPDDWPLTRANYEAWSEAAQ